jgi:hypothetical protein
VTPGAAGRTYIFSWCSIPSTFNNRINWETSCISSSVVMGLAVLLTRAT